MNKKLLYIANWKMYLSYAQADTWCKAHDAELRSLGKKESIIICPEFSALSTIRKQLDSSIAIGAQNCSAHVQGAYTGEVPAQSLKEVGATYCIVGHSERRKNLHETPQEVARKIVRLQEHDITPIVCVSDEFETELSPVLEAINPNKKTIFAYEPVSAIGTGNVPSNEQITQVLEKIKNNIKKNLPQIEIALLYGGSVNSHSVHELKKISLIDGFLIGSASTDFQELKKIVL